MSMGSAFGETSSTQSLNGWFARMGGKTGWHSRHVKILRGARAQTRWVINSENRDSGRLQASDFHGSSALPIISLGLHQSVAQQLSFVEVEEETQDTDKRVGRSRRHIAELQILATGDHSQPSFYWLDTILPILEGGVIAQHVAPLVANLLRYRLVLLLSDCEVAADGTVAAASHDPGQLDAVSSTSELCPTFSPPTAKAYTSLIDPSLLIPELTDSNMWYQCDVPTHVTKPWLGYVCLAARAAMTVSSRERDVYVSKIQRRSIVLCCSAGQRDMQLHTLLWSPSFWNTPPTKPLHVFWASAIKELFPILALSWKSWQPFLGCYKIFICSGFTAGFRFSPARVSSFTWTCA